MGLSIETMTNYFISRTGNIFASILLAIVLIFIFACRIVDSLPEETFATFVVPNSVTLTRRQTEILSSLQTRQGVPFCLDYEGLMLQVYTASTFILSHIFPIQERFPSLR